MASVQRDHWSFIVLQCLLLSLLICRHASFADKNKYFHISSLCGRDRNFQQYKKIDGAVLTSESENNLDCVITFQTDSILQKFMLRFDRLALDCNDHLIIFDGAHAIGKPKVDLSCRSIRSDVGQIFTHSNYVTLKYKTDDWNQAGNGFRLIITAFKDPSRLDNNKQDVKCKEYECQNKFCISSGLICDGVNHCGDDSDETSYAFCVDDASSGQIFGIGVSVFVTIIIVAFFLCLLCVVGVVICLFRQQHAAQSPPVLQPPAHQNYPTQPRYGGAAERISEKPPPYPGNMYPPATRIAFHVPQESVYYPTK